MALTLRDVAFEPDRWTKAMVETMTKPPISTVSNQAGPLFPLPSNDFVSCLFFFALRFSFRLRAGFFLDSLLLWRSFDIGDAPGCVETFLGQYRRCRPSSMSLILSDTLRRSRAAESIPGETGGATGSEYRRPLPTPGHFQITAMDLIRPS